MTSPPAPSPPPCERCGDPMALVRRVPRLAAHPELLTFRCEGCQHVQTLEADDEG